MDVPFLAYPNQVKREHDKLAKVIIGAIEKEIGIRCGPFRDCKTGKYRSLNDKGEK